MDRMSKSSSSADIPSPIGSLWERTATAPPSTKQLDLWLTTDVAVIGGGYTGLSTALHLGEKGIKTVLLEAQTIGFGASGRNGGQAKMTTAMLDRLTHHCDIIETGNDSWRFKNRA